MKDKENITRWFKDYYIFFSCILAINNSGVENCSNIFHWQTMNWPNQIVGIRYHIRYYNMFLDVFVPVPCLYAHKLADLVDRNVKTKAQLIVIYFAKYLISNKKLSPFHKVIKVKLKNKNWKQLIILFWVAQHLCLTKMAIPICYVLTFMRNAEFRVIYKKYTKCVYILVQSYHEQTLDKHMNM